MKMNKLLLVWNLVLTVLLAGVLVNGCGPQYDYSADIRTNRELIEQVSNLANQNRTAINSNNQAILANKIAVETLASTTQATINALEASLMQYIEQYVKATSGQQ